MKVWGDVPLSELTKAGSFDNINVIPVGVEIQKISFWKNKRNNRMMITGLLLILAFYLDFFTSAQAGLLFSLYLVITLLGAFNIFKKGYKRLFLLQFDMNVLMSIAVTGAFLIGEWREGALVAFLFAVSEWLESYSFDKARNAIRSIMELAPKKATVKRKGIEQILAVSDIKIGDILVVKPGEKIAMDGIVKKGSSTINQAAITGESIPVEKTIGNQVFAGTLNEQGYLEVLVTKLAKDTTIAKIINLVEEAQGKKAQSQAFVDRFARVYTPVVLILAVFIAIVPPLLLAGNWNESIYNSLALLVVACPCALVVSTPVAVVSAIGNAAKQGVVIKGGIYLEKLAVVNQFAFDKTGTLTEGNPKVVGVTWYTNEQNKELAIAAAIEKQSNHPISKAVVKYVQQIEAKTHNVEYFSEIIGNGVKGIIEGKEYFVVKPEFVKKFGIINETIQEKISVLQNQGSTVIVMATNEQVLGLIVIQDTIRATSKRAILQMKKLGVSKIVMLTGDNPKVGQAIATSSGIDHFFAELLPNEKVEKVEQLQKQGFTAMVGDGVNDAPALALADVGIAMGGAGSDSALETADVVLMADDLEKLPFTINLSRKTLQIIKQNIALAIVIKFLAILLVFPGWLTLWLAIFADMGATILVTLNGIRLFRVRNRM